MQRKTFADVDNLQYRLRAAGALLGVTDTTLRGYADNAGLTIKRASDITPGAPAVRIFGVDTMFDLSQWRRSRGYTLAPASSVSKPKIIAVSVVKGGTGKTTTAVEVAVHFQLLGLRTLLIDLDVQANATQMLGYEPDLTIEEAPAYDLHEDAIVTSTFATVLLPFLERSRPGHSLKTQETCHIIKKPFGENGPHLVAADTYLGDIEQSLANAKGQRELFIKHLLNAAYEGLIPGFDTSTYDVILFDCPPNVSFTSTGALAAADIVVAPIRMDAFSVKGMVKIMQEIESLNSTYGIKPNLVILPTHYSPQLVRIGRMQEQLNKYRDMLAQNVISASEEYPKSLDFYLPLSLQKPTSTAAKEYRMFSEFLLKRIVKPSKGKLT